MRNTDAAQADVRSMEFLRYAPVNPGALMPGAIQLTRPGVQKEMIESARKFSTAPKA